MEDYGKTTFEDLKTRLRTLSQVFVRLAVRGDGSGQRLLHAMVVDALPELPVQALGYDYGSVAFVGEKISGTVLAEWLSLGRGEVAGYSFSVPTLSPDVSWHRVPSHTKYGYLSARWPFTQFEINIGSNAAPRDAALSVGYLASDMYPFFPDYRTAAFELLHRVTERELGSDLPREIIDVRIAHPEAWIEHVHFSPSSVSVTIDGDSADGTRLEVVGSPNLRWDKSLTQSGDYGCPLPSGIPKDLWIVLSREGVRLDYRHVNQLWSPFSETVENLTFEAPDIRTRLEEHLYRGEGETIEFKRELPRNKDKLLKTVAAFANGEGGVILVGVDDDGTVVGVGQPINEGKDGITNLIRNTVVPEPRIHLDDGKIDDKDVIAIYVDKGDSPPYCLHPDKPEAYVRRGGTTFRARQDEIRALGQRGPAQVTQQR